MTSNFIDISDLKKRKDFTLGYGHFTTIHPGHIRYLKHAKSLGSTLIIALKGDGNLEKKESKYQFNQGERAEALALLDIADFLILLKDDEIDEIVKVTNPKLLILGKQFERSPEEKVQRAMQLLSKRGVATFFHGGDINYFNSELLTSSEDEMRAKKPVGIYWLQAASGKTFGLFDIGSFRIPSLITSIISMIFTYLIARLIFPFHQSLIVTMFF